MTLVRTILTEQSRVVSILTLILLLWVTNGAAIYTSNNPSDIAAQEQSAPTDDTNQDQAPEVILSSFQEAVIPISKIHILFICHFLREWILVEDDHFIISTDNPLTANRFFLTLFRQIISPNAP
ncbi:MAG: hypothetical protein AAGE93_14485 [Bacteroidota bacterium]